MGSFIVRRLFSKFDETDSLKRMRDSDILAQEEKKSPGYGSVASAAAGGAAVGAIAGGIGKGIGSAAAGKGLWKGLKSGGKWGAIIGGGVAGAVALHNRNKQAEENNFYNDRLRYAKHQAERRERIDWKNNMTQREGYSY